MPFGFDAVPDDPASARGGEVGASMWIAHSEAVECMGAAGGDHFEREVVVVAANVTLGHNASESKRRAMRRARKLTRSAVRRQRPSISAAGAASVVEAPARTAG